MRYDTVDINNCLKFSKKIPELPHLMVFIIPSELVKNGDERLVVCNDTAKAAVESQRGMHATHVFSFRGSPLARMLSTGWRVARKKAGLSHVRIHDLKHWSEIKISWCEL